MPSVRKISCLLLLSGLLVITSLPAFAQNRGPIPDRATVIGNISKANLQNKFPNAVITELGTDRATGNKIYEVRGGPENIAELLKSDSQITHVDRHGTFSKQQLDSMEKLIGSTLSYHGTVTYGSSLTRPGKPYTKIDQCWVCKACAEPNPPPMMPAELLPNCPKPANLDDLYDEWAKWAALTQVLTDLLDTYNLFDYWRSVGGMLKDMVSAATILLPGAGTVLSRGLNMLIEMAANGVLDSMIGEMLDKLGLENLNTRGAISAALSEANAMRVSTHQAYFSVLQEWIACKNNVNTENIKRQADLDAWNAVKDKYLADWKAYEACLNSPTRCSYQTCR